MIIYNTNMEHANIFLVHAGQSVPELETVKAAFCGTAVHVDNAIIPPNSLVYICCDFPNRPNNGSLYYAVKGYAKYNHNTQIVTLGEIPLHIPGIGIYFPQFFDNSKNYFDMISTEHEFQTLTESNKSGTALRKGIYLTPIEKHGDELHYHFLRCSSNLSGPSENFRETDIEIVSKLNNISRYFFPESAHFNHILAQIYDNYADVKPKKARIKAHSDKTKDMPQNGLMAFCTFYDGQKPQCKQFGNDWHYKNDSVLTKIRFRLKPTVSDSSFKNLVDVTLYPNSVLIIPLLTNRLYTHEIVPSCQEIKNLPTRMGYVVRCSKTQVVYRDDAVYFSDGCKLEKMTPENMERLRELYFLENTTTDVINYEKFPSSMNDGDYKKPIF